MTIHYERNRKTACGQMIYRNIRVTNPWRLLKILADEPEKAKLLCKICVAEARVKTGQNK